jgi:hypothetical protein
MNDPEQSALPQTLLDVFTGIASERGGIESFNTAQRVALRALVRVLANMSAGDVSKAGSIEALTDMLPPKLGAAAGETHVDLSTLSDEELKTLENIATRLQPGPPPANSIEAALADANRQIGVLHEMITTGNSQLRMAQDAIAVERRLAVDAKIEADRLRAALERGQASAAKPPTGRRK